MHEYHKILVNRSDYMSIYKMAVKHGNIVGLSTFNFFYYLDSNGTPWEVVCLY